MDTPPPASSETPPASQVGNSSGRALQDEFFGKLVGPSHLFQLFKFLPDISYFVKDKEGRLMAIGGGILQFIGVACEQDVLTHTDATFFPPHIAHAIRVDDLRVMQMGHPLVDRLEQLSSNRGSRRWFLTNKLPITDTGGSVIGIMGFLRPYKADSDPVVSHQVLKAIAYIHQHHGENLSTDDLAEKFHLSVRHLNRLFHKSLGTGVQDFILRTRLDAVCRSLITTDRPVADIAYEHGFYDQSAMSRHFRQHTGESPQTWRKRHSRPAHTSGTIQDVLARKAVQNAFFSQLSRPLPLRLLLEHLPDVDYFAKDHAGRFTAIRSATIVRLGFRSEEEAIGKTDFDIHPVNVAQAIRNDDLAVMRTRQPIVDQLEDLYTRANVKGWFLTTKLPITDSNEQVIGVMGFVRPAPDCLAMGDTRSQLQHVLAHIREHYSERLLISDLACIAKVSPRQLNRMFQESFRLSAQDFIIRTRVQAASADLVSTRKPLAEIASAHGFCDSSTFTRQFRHHFGENPLSYRRRRVGG